MWQQVDLTEGLLWVWWWVHTVPGCFYSHLYCRLCTPSSEANYGREWHGAHFLRPRGHIVKSCRPRYERLLWNSSGLGVMKSHFGTFANTPERLLNLTKCWGDFLAKGMIVRCIHFRGRWNKRLCHNDFMHQFSYTQSHIHRLSKKRDCLVSVFFKKCIIICELFPKQV